MSAPCPEPTVAARRERAREAYLEAQAALGKYAQNFAVEGGFACRQCHAVYQEAPLPAHPTINSIGTGERHWIPEEGLCPSCWEAYAMRIICVAEIGAILPDGSEGTWSEAHRLQPYHFDHDANALVARIMRMGGAL